MSNALNKSMVSGWAAHQPAKRSKLNLNASTSANSSGAEDAGPSGEAGPSASTSSTTTGAVKRRTRPSSSTGTDPSLKRQKSSSAGMASSSNAGGSSRAPPEARLSSLGGLTGTIEKLLELVALPLLHPELYIHTGVAPPRGVLLHGPPGCGKTAIANALAGVSAPSFSSRRPERRRISLTTRTERGDAWQHGCGLAQWLTVLHPALSSDPLSRSWACPSSASPHLASSAACRVNRRRRCARRSRKHRSVHYALTAAVARPRPPLMPCIVHLALGHCLSL